MRKSRKRGLDTLFRMITDTPGSNGQYIDGPFDPGVLDLTAHPSRHGLSKRTAHHTCQDSDSATVPARI